MRGSTSSTVKQENYLFHNNGNKTFSKITSGPIANYKGCVWTSAWGDVDNDGDLDLFVGTIYQKTNLLYLNNGDGTFTEAYIDSNNTVPGGTGITGASFGDYDNDGFIDLLVSDASNYGYLIYHNNGNKNNWLSVECKGKVSNGSAIGARVKIKATIFGKTFWQIREITGVQGFRGSNDLRTHFGLGDAAKIDSLVIIFPSKQVTVMKDVQVNQFIKVTETVPLNYIKSNFKADTLSGYSPLKVKFTDLSQSNETRPVTSWSWDFNGDGMVDSKEKNPTYVYDIYAGKNLSVSLKVSNGIDSATSVRNDYIKISPMYEQNIALHKTATASSSISTYYSVDNITDGLTRTRWLSAVSDTQWVQIRLDSVYSIGKIVLDWFSNYAVQYKIIGSKDSVDWFDIFSNDNGTGTLEELLFNSVRAKYIRLEMNKSSNNNGFGLNEIKIFRPEVTAVYNGKKIPNEFCLLQNFPNPFNPATVISYQLPQGFAGNVSLKIYDILGRVVKTLVNETKTAGSYSINFNAENLSSGIYFYSLRAGNLVNTKKMLLLR